MFDIAIDLERAGVRAPASPAQLGSSYNAVFAPLKRLPGTATVPGKVIMQYVMTHDPGNTIKNQRRRFYASISHGVKWINFFALETYATSGGDFCDGYNGMYPAVLKEIREYGMFSDIVAEGVPQAQGAKAAIVFSQTSDIYLDDFGTGASAKRSLYIAIRHAQIALDVVIEEDIIDNTVSEYAVLFLNAPHITQAAAEKLASWVEKGGTLIGSVGMGLLNETNQTNHALANVFGINSHAVSGTEAGVGTNEIVYIKQDLAFVDILTTATVSSQVLLTDTTDEPMPVLGEMALLELTSPGPTKAETLATFKDGSPAMFARKRGQGTAVAVAFHLGLAYFRSSMPKRPPARGNTDLTFNHFVPTEFQTSARDLLEHATSHVVGVQPVLASPERRIDVGIIAAAGKGTAIPIVNWGPGPVPQQTLTLQFECDFKAASLATGGHVAVSKNAAGQTVLTFALDIADTVILR